MSWRTWKPPLLYFLPVSELGPPVKVGASDELQLEQMSCTHAQASQSAAQISASTVSRQQAADLMLDLQAHALSGKGCSAAGRQSCTEGGA